MSNSVLEYLFLYWDKTLYWNIYFCSGIYIFLFWNIHISVLEYVFISALEYTFLYWNTYFVLELTIFLYWNTHFCAGIYQEP